MVGVAGAAGFFLWFLGIEMVLFAALPIVVVVLVMLLLLLAGTLFVVVLGGVVLLLPLPVGFLFAGIVSMFTLLSCFFFLFLLSLLI